MAADTAIRMAFYDSTTDIGGHLPHRLIRVSPFMESVDRVSSFVNTLPLTTALHSRPMPQAHHPLKRAHRLSTAGVLILFAISTQGQPVPITVMDQFSIRNVSSPDVSPDGEWVAYTVTETLFEKQTTRSRVWMSSIDGRHHLPMTIADADASDPKFSPDGRYLTFLSARGGDGKTQVWAMSRLGGEADPLTRVKQGVSEYAWSPDGTRLLLTIRDATAQDGDEPRPFVIDRQQFKRDYVGYLDRRRSHLYVMAIGDTTLKRLTHGDFDNNQAVWSPDGTRIAFVSNRSANPDATIDSNIWIVDAGKGEQVAGLVQVTTNPGTDTQPAWSPDGRSIAYVTSIQPELFWYATSHLAVSEAKSNSPARILTQEIDRNVNQPSFSADGRNIRFIVEDAGRTHLARINPTGRTMERIVSGDVTINGYSAHPDLVVTLTGSFQSPDELHVVQSNRSRQLTHHNRGFLERIEMPAFEEIRFPSADGTTIHGFLIKPNGYREGVRYPTLLWIHGGPVAQYEHSYMFTPHLFAANGYAVLLINPRGSSGYGQAFSQILFADWGNKDYEDVMAGVSVAIDRGFADPGRLGVGGWSYGGILTNYVITKTNRFKGAVSGASETLMRSNYGHDHYQLYWEKELGLPWETPENWERLSSFNHVAKIETPTLWIGGAADWNVPIIGSEQMYQAMKRLGRETLLVVYPGEHHGIERPSFQKDMVERYLHWFDRHVKQSK
jgi:dipeptidyl aminopeptidase/acylaminoacyl peptidase